MNHLKFRAFANGKMRYDVTGFEHGEKNEMLFIFLNGDAYKIGSECEVMQFTGLTDKNGTDIYDGDEVDFVGGTTANLYTHNGEYHTKGTRLIVRQLNSGFTLMLPRHSKMDTPAIVGNVTQYTFWSHSRSLVVVGNIYE